MTNKRRRPTDGFVPATSDNLCLSLEPLENEREKKFNKKISDYLKAVGMIAETQKLDDIFYHDLESIIENSRFWLENNDYDESDFQVYHGEDAIQTDAARVLNLEVSRFFKNNNLPIVTVVESVDPLMNPNTTIGQNHSHYPDRVVLGGFQSLTRNNRNMIVLHLATFGENYNPDDVCPRLMSKSVSRVLRHEVIHSCQLDKRSKNQKISRKTAKDRYIAEGQIPVSEEKNRKEYLRSHIEIDAYAHEIAEELFELLGYSGSIDVLRNRKNVSSLPISSSAKEYLHEHKRKDFSLKLLKKVYSHLRAFDGKKNLEKISDRVLRRISSGALILSEGVYDPGIFKVIFLAGGPGSGKSTVVNNTIFPERHGLKVVNIDAAFELFLKRSNTSMDMTSGTPEDRKSRMRAFNKARSLTKKKKGNYVDSRLGLVIDGTGGRFAVIRNQKKKFEDLGYETFMVYVDTTLDVAKERNIGRGQRGGRRLRDKDLKRSWAAVNKNKELYLDLFGKDNIAIIDGDTFDPGSPSAHTQKIQGFIEAPARSQIAIQWMRNELEMKRSPGVQAESLIRKCVRGILLEKSLTGRRLEKVAEKIANEVIEYLLDSDLRDAFAAQGALKFQVDMDLPESLVWLRNVFVEMTPANDFNTTAAYEFDLDATEEQREDSDIVLRLHLPSDYEDEEIERFKVEIESDLRHELEHSGQPTDILMDVQRKVPDSEIWKSLQRAEDYYMSQAEIPSYVSQMVLKSKRKGMNAADVIDKELYNIYATGFDEGYTEEELSPLMTKMRNVWQYYLMTRWPEQDWPLEFRPDEEPA